MTQAMNLINSSITRFTDEKLKVMVNVKKLHCEKTIMITSSVELPVLIRSNRLSGSVLYKFSTQ